MASISTQKGTAMTRFVPRAAPTFPNPLERVGTLIASFNLDIGFIRLVALVNSLLLLALIWMLVVPDAPLGVLRIAITPNTPREPLVGFVAFFLLSDIFQIRRNNTPQWAMLMSVSGQVPIVVCAFVGVVQGVFTPIALYAPLGVMSLSLIGIAIVVQSDRASRPPFTPIKYPAQKLVYPVLSALMGWLGSMLILRRDSIITSFIIDYPLGLGLFALLIVFLAWGHGQLRQNHLSPKQMSRRLTGVIMFAFLIAALFVNEGAGSFLGVTMNILVAVLGVYLSFMEARHYATTASQGS